MSYTLGNSESIQENPIAQEPRCYEETVTIGPAVSWLTADTGTDELSLNLDGTFDRSLIGSHTFTVYKEIAYADGIALDSYSTLSEAETFTVEIEDPCLGATLSDASTLEAREMLGLVGGDQDYQVLSMIDDVSESIGAAACGSASVEILGADPAEPDYGLYLSVAALDQQNFNITLWTSDVSHVGDYEITYRVALEGFPDLTYTGTFVARIRFCFLERLIPSPITPRLYQLGDEE